VAFLLAPYFWWLLRYKAIASLASEAATKGKRDIPFFFFFSTSNASYYLWLLRYHEATSFDCFAIAGCSATTNIHFSSKAIQAK
jgi:hypothetical protein